MTQIRTLDLSNNKIYIYNQNGKRGEIVLQNSLVSFSINASGTVAVIEEVSNGHIVSAYDSAGRFLDVHSGSFTANGDYPVTAEICPNNEFILVSYLYLGGVELSSSVGAISIIRPSTETIEPMVYGNIEYDNLVYNIEFINDTTWATIGDNYITFYDIGGELIRRIFIDNMMFKPYLNSIPKVGGYIPVITSTNTLHSQSELMLIDDEKERIINLDFELPIKYYNANSTGVVVGDGRVFKGYNKIGVQFLEYQVTQDITQVIASDNLIIAVTKDSIVRLENKKE